MQHVMVPVPEEHLAEFQAALISMAMGMAGWDEAAVLTFLDALPDLGESAQLVVRVVAEASAEHQRVHLRVGGQGPRRRCGRGAAAGHRDQRPLPRSDLPLLLLTAGTATVEPDGSPGATPVLVMAAAVATKILNLWPTGATPTDP